MGDLAVQGHITTLADLGAYSWLRVLGCRA